MSPKGTYINRSVGLILICWILIFTVCKCTTLGLKKILKQFDIVVILANFYWLKDV